MASSCTTVKEINVDCLFMSQEENESNESNRLDGYIIPFYNYNPLFRP